MPMLEESITLYGYALTGCNVTFMHPIKSDY